VFVTFRIGENPLRGNEVEEVIPNAPGLGLELNDGLVKEHLRFPGYFEPTPEYDMPGTSNFQRRWAGPWPHYDEEGKWCNCVTR
jgi:hypothetical protein